MTGSRIAQRHGENVETAPRTRLKRAELIGLALYQGGLCGCGCGRPILCPEGFIDEHVLPLWAGGGNDLLNRRLYRKLCAQAKTGVEAEQRARADRRAGKTGQRARRERNGATLTGRNDLAGRAGKGPSIPKPRDPWGKGTGRKQKIPSRPMRRSRAPMTKTEDA